jgi:2-oxoglutarate ferredoxin oxidoreductase subunit beta
MAAIGTAEMIHAANRAEKFTTIFVNNAIYGMTGGQMAPTTLIGQKATTAPKGRDAEEAGMGYPIRVAEMLATLDGTRYIARGAVNNAANVRKTRQFIKKAFLAQMAGMGSTMVEILSPCPTNWTMDPVQAVEWLEKNMIPVFPLGEVKNTLEGGQNDRKVFLRWVRRAGYHISRSIVGVFCHAGRKKRHFFPFLRGGKAWRHSKGQRNHL